MTKGLLLPVTSSCTGNTLINTPSFLIHALFTQDSRASERREAWGCAWQTNMETIVADVDIADGAATPGAVPLDVGAPVVATPAPNIWRCDICACTITTKGDGRMEAAHLAGKPHLKKLRALGLAPALESRKPAQQACSTSVGPSSKSPPTPWLAQGGTFLLPCGHTRYSWQGFADVVPPGHTPFSWGTAL